MSRDEFFAKVAQLDEERLHKALWNLYWRGTAPMRERIEAELTPDTGLPRRKAPEPADPARVREETEDFVALARAGAYIAGSRRVSPKERSRWRFTFKRGSATGAIATTVERSAVCRHAGPSWAAPGDHEVRDVGWHGIVLLVLAAGVPPASR